MAKIVKFIAIICAFICLSGCTNDTKEVVTEQVESIDKQSNETAIDKKREDKEINSDYETKKTSNILMDEEFIKLKEKLIAEYNLTKDNKYIATSYSYMLRDIHNEWNINEEFDINNNAMAKVLALHSVEFVYSLEDYVDVYESFIRFILNNTHVYLLNAEKLIIDSEQLAYNGINEDHTLMLEFMLDGFNGMDNVSSNLELIYGRWGKVLNTIDHSSHTLDTQSKQLIQCSSYLLHLNQENNMFIYSTYRQELDTTYDNHIINRNNYIEDLTSIEIINLEAKTVLPKFRYVTGEYKRDSKLYFTDRENGLMLYDFNSSKLIKPIDELEVENVHLIDVIDNTMHLLISNKTFYYNIDSGKLTKVESDLTADPRYCKGMKSSIAANEYIGGLFNDFESTYLSDENEAIVKAGLINDIKSFDNKFYFTITSSHYLYEYDSYTNKKDYLLMEPLDQFYIYDNWLYYVSLQNERHIKRINLETKEVETVIDKSVGFVYVDERYIYYNSIKGNYRLYRFNKELSYSEKLTDIPVRNVVTLGEYVYYETITDEGEHNINYFHGNSSHNELANAYNLKQFDDKVLFFRDYGINVLKYVTSDTLPQGKFYGFMSYKNGGVVDYWLTENNIWFEYAGEGGHKGIGVKEFKPDKEFLQHSLNDSIWYKRQLMCDKDAIIGFNQTSEEMYSIAKYSFDFKVYDDVIILIDPLGYRYDNKEGLYIVNTKDYSRELIKEIGPKMAIDDYFLWGNKLYYSYGYYGYYDLICVDLDTKSEGVFGLEMDHLAYAWEDKIGYWYNGLLYLFDNETKTSKLLSELSLISESRYIFNDYYYYGYKENGKAHVQRIKYDGSSQVDVLLNLSPDDLIFQDQYIYAANLNNEVIRYNMESFSHEIIGVMEKSFYFDKYSNKLVIN